MILDALENAHRYMVLHKGFEKAFGFLFQPGLAELPAGKYEIDGNRVHATVSAGPGRGREDALLETHEKHVDIQLVLDGTDEMGWKPESSCRHPSGEYDANNDVRFFADEPDVLLSVGRGVFAIFFPEDAHRPQVSSGRLHKVVVKVAVNPDQETPTSR